MARITLIGKPGCHLCDVAQEVIEKVSADTGAGWRKVSIDDDRALKRKYWDKIPVIMVDDAEFAMYRVEEEGLRAALER
ncbi:MAG: glutaredoxin family protein [Kineosporiaceae bacterium]|nr:glutaredoxin family protein [Kineosporiaceae bacterium]